MTPLLNAVTLIAQLALLTSVLLALYIYLGYPVLMFLLSRLFPQPVRKTGIEPRVSLIIAAHNEQQHITDKLNNALALDYPPDKLEIIVASDCSTDQTDDIVRRFADRRVKLYAQADRQGKTRAQHRAASISTGDILIFSDATTQYQPGVIRTIVRGFADPTVGCVAGQLVYVDGPSSSVGNGCRSYWGYEKFIKDCESRLGSLIGVSGCLYAVRRSCQARMASDMIDDFVIATEIRLQGLRTIYEPEAICTESTNQRTRDEFRMRVRVIEQTMNALHRYRAVLNPRRYGMYAFQLICHKLLRYSLPLWLGVAFVASWFADTGAGLFHLLFVGQMIFYLLALVGWVAERCNIRLGLLSVPWYFMLFNAASVVALLKFLRGETHVVWEPVREARAESTVQEKAA